MFGYIKVFEPELKMREYEQYKAVYCSLCRTLGKRYGLLSRMTLSYDFTFLAIYLMALRDESVSFLNGRCPFKPHKKRMFCCESSVLDYAADVAVLLVYHKLADTIQDERFLKRISARLLKALFASDYNKARARRPKEAEAAICFMQSQREVETSEAPCIDACAEPTAAFLRVISAFEANDEYRDIQERFGYCLGRFIYLADAAQDLTDDFKYGSFNPFLVRFGSIDETTRQYAAESLYASASVCAQAASELPFHRFKGLIDNVLYKGIPHVIQQICNNKPEGCSCEKSI